MTPAALLAVVNAALGLTESLLPKLAEMVKSGEVTPAEQNEVLQRFQALKNAAEKNFTGPEWQVEP